MNILLEPSASLYIHHARESGLLIVTGVRYHDLQMQRNNIFCLDLYIAVQLTADPDDRFVKIV